MNRERMLADLKGQKQWDIIVIGGGASGLGTALDAVSRGYSTLLLEQGDFAQATSSRSTKLIHGGIRYLRSGQIALVREALHERSLLVQNAPHLVHPLPFLLPTESLCSKLFYFSGIKLYDILSGNKVFKSSSMLSKEEMQHRLPTVNPQKFSGGICYSDGQFDDARMAINLAQTIVDHGGTAINYMSVQNLLKNNGKVSGVVAHDAENKQDYEIHAKSVVNATGVFVDTIRHMDNHNDGSIVVPSQGAHIVLDRTFFPGDSALIIPETADGRVLFAIPWHNRVLVGTTDTQMKTVSMEPTPLKEEITYLLDNIGRYFLRRPTEADILSTFAGLRPLVKPKGEWKGTASLSREYMHLISDSQLITLCGGKWTTYRKMGQKTVDIAARIGKLADSPSKTQDMHIHGWTPNLPASSEWQFYGSDFASVKQLANGNPEMLQKLHADLPCREVDIVWAVRQEMALNLEDVLARRTRSLILGARASQEIAPQVAKIMAKTMNKDSRWETAQVKAYRELAQKYLL